MLPREYEEPFDSVRKMMSTVHRISEDYFFSKHAELASGDSIISADRPDGGKEAAATGRPDSSSGAAKNAAVLGSRTDNHAKYCP